MFSVTNVQTEIKRIKQSYTRPFDLWVVSQLNRLVTSLRKVVKLEFLKNEEITDHGADDIREKAE